MLRFREILEKNGAYPLRSESLDILQVNLGYRCNMACKHCHVDAGPDRSEIMARRTIDAVIAALGSEHISTLDITGGAPELNPDFRYLVIKARKLGKHVIVRSNLTVLYEKDMSDLPEFFRDVRVEIIASLPYYIEDNVDRVRGAGAFDKSIDALRRLNELGYSNGSDLNINLVYNPQGAFLPSQQSSLKDEYKKELRNRFGIEFNELYTFTNMPIGRFKNFLERNSNLKNYVAMLSSSFNPDTLGGIMCRFLINVSWDGSLYDCDFNQVTALRLLDRYPQNIIDFDAEALKNRDIAVDDHCYGCTAGQGST
ncbi:MAG: arsenosugar biosynthesis radical SAM protein ArsS [Nitrospirota bacterium]|nr:MAG: arsenosugar biosynthesis radical SAM protein ArsS [Nitrospirota bacterium]